MEFIRLIEWNTARVRTLQDWELVVQVCSPIRFRDFDRIRRRILQESKPPTALLRSTIGKSHDKSMAGPIIPPEGSAKSPIAGTNAARTWKKYRRIADHARSISLVLHFREFGGSFVGKRV